MGRSLIKDGLHCEKPASLELLKQVVEAEWADLDQDVLSKLARGSAKRLRMLVADEGRSFLQGFPFHSSRISPRSPA
jgi:hypothetical protein